jgi:hypothetical protein
MGVGQASWTAHWTVNADEVDLSCHFCALFCCSGRAQGYALKSGIIGVLLHVLPPIERTIHSAGFPCTLSHIRSITHSIKPKD